MDFLLVLLLVVFLALLAKAVRESLWGTPRSKTLADWATEHDLTFEGPRQEDFNKRFPDLKCLNEGHSQYARNVMGGTWSDLPIVAFDYRCINPEWRRESKERDFSAVIGRSPCPLKPLQIRLEDAFDKLDEFVGIEDIDFESAEFSRKFYVTAADKRWAYDIIHERMMEHLLAAPEFLLEFAGTHVIVWREEQLTPDGFEVALDHVAKIIDLIPDYVVEQQRGAAKGGPGKT